MKYNTLKRRFRLPALIALAALLACSGALASETVNMKKVIKRIEDLVKIETFRTGDPDNEAHVREQLEIIRKNYLQKWVDEFNGESRIKLSPFEWKSEDKKYWVFGWRAGKGSRKISILSHLDTVGPGNLDWQPFKPRVEERIYKGAPARFLVGRGTIDDKGPAVVGLEVLMQTVATLQDSRGSLNDVTLELLLDTSEETDMSTPHFYEANPGAEATLGVVFDAFWCIRAEKGIARPEFTVKPDAVPKPSEGALHISELVSAEGAVNMIPTSATATIKGPPEALAAFASKVEGWYRAYRFDDVDYRPADLEVGRSTDGAVTLKTLVAGAQHGSAPVENRANGANPVAALTNFLAGLVDNGVLANSPAGELSRFIRWAFGTRVLGETHPDLLERFDSVFREGNGTTYGLTTLKSEGGSASLEIDIRYAIGHHAQGWDGSAKQLTGDSLFEPVFTQLIENYRNDANGADVVLSFTLSPAIPPDIRDSRSANLSKINAAYRAVMGANCPMYAIGGGTDAKGHPELIAAGALFTDNMGPPINFHGLDEGAPLIDLENSARVLLYLLKQEVSTPERLFTHYRHGGHMDVR